MHSPFSIFRATTAFALGLLCLLLTPPPAHAQNYHFEEGDWIAWADSRTVNHISQGHSTLYFATDGGVHRWDRNRKSWLIPWFTVPAYMDKAIHLARARQVVEDPLSRDVYVQLPEGWVVRDNGRLEWERVEAVPEEVRDRLRNSKLEEIQVPQSLIPPPGYLIGMEGELKKSYLDWPFRLGGKTEWGQAFLAWEGFGIGVFSEYNSLLELYPLGPGPATAMDVNDEVVWATSVLNQQEGWLWKRDRNGDRWQFFHPSLEWGLETGRVNALRIAKNGTVWLASRHGVMYGSGGNWKHIRKTDGLPRSEIFDVEPFGDGAWVASRFGMAYIDEESGYVRRPDRKAEPLPAGGMFSQLASHGDTLYAASPGALLAYSGDGPWREVPLPTTIGAGEEVLALYAQDSLLALGTHRGFAWRNGAGEWDQAFGLQWSDGAVYAIEYHGGYFWLGTDRGLVKYDPVQRDAIRFDAEQGLPGNEVLAIHGEGDWLWLGTDVALARFHWKVAGRLD